MATMGVKGLYKLPEYFHDYNRTFANEMNYTRSTLCRREAETIQRRGRAKASFEAETQKSSVFLITHLCTYKEHSFITIM